MDWRFAHPWVLVLSAIIPIIWGIAYLRERRRSGAMSPVISRVRAAGGSMRTRTRWMPSILKSLALLLLLGALARPQEIVGNTTSQRDAIALELVVDRSGSMNDAVVFHGKRTNRLGAVKEVVELFVLGDGGSLNGREGDLLGLIVFGTYADTLMPLTQSHEPLIEALRAVKVADDEREKATSIGDAIMLASARLKASEDAMKSQADDPDFVFKSKAIVLLTDGENSAGQFTPNEAAQLAADWGIKVYIIGIQGGTSQVFGGLRLAMGNEVNDRKMTRVAEYTGGKYWGVQDIEDLAQIYAQIDELERTTITINESTSYRELYQPLAIGALIGLSLATMLSATVYRRSV
ncbi:MAG: VWA domain-containing protein [Phycisphaerales bacterium]|nr:VWA domain-containing protein [Phycisphaerales bacterium]